MTEKYKRQLEIEKLNNNIAQYIINNRADELIAFYKTHNRRKTLAHFGIRTEKQLVKILKKLNYDFSFEKHLNKGKPSPRSHESYIRSRKKSAKTQVNNWQNKSLQEKKRWRELQSKAHSTEQFKKLKAEQTKEYQNSLSKEEKAKQNKQRSKTMKAFIHSLSESEFDTRLKNSQKYKTFKYDEVYFDSFPELCFYLYNKAQHINIIRTYNIKLSYYFKGEKHFYLPDFIIDNKYYEIKGDHLYEKLLIPNTLDNAKYQCRLKNNYKKEDFLNLK